MKKIIVLVSMVMALGLFAQDKVGYVNMSEVFEQYYKTVNANIIFEKKKQEFEDKMAVLRSDLENAMRDVRTVEAEAKNELLSQQDREEAIRKYRVRAELFQNKQEEAARTRQQSVNDLRRSQKETEDLLVKELRELMEKFAANNGYTHIYDVSGNSLNGLPLLLVYPKQQEITNAFVGSVNAGHDAEIADAKAKLEAMRSAKKAPEAKNE